MKNTTTSFHYANSNTCICLPPSVGSKSITIKKIHTMGKDNETTNDEY